MSITFAAPKSEDIEPLYQLNKALIDAYESIERIDYDRVLRWVHRKLEACLGEYTVLYADGQKAGYYHFYRKEDGEYELDDLYILPEFQNRGIGSAVIERCLASVNAPVMLYVFIRNEGAVSLYKRHGFKVTETVNDSRYIMKRDPRSYYEAYEERYRTAHAQGVRWASDVRTPIVLDVIERYRIRRDHRLLEIGCGEGRDSRALLEKGYSLTATDCSREAIAYCQGQMPQYAQRFRVLDCLSDPLEQSYDFIFAVAVVHMLVPDRDRDGFYQFIRNHLTSEGVALICTMGDGEVERQSDISQAFTLQERRHESGSMMVACTSCRMVSFPTFREELARNGFRLLEQGVTQSPPDFNSLMYAVVARQQPLRPNALSL